MSSLRILYANVADEAITVVADSTAGALGVANLLTDIKSEVHRATGTSVRYTLTWANAQFLNMAALPFCNFSSTATMRARVYTNVADVVDVDDPAGDSGAVLCCAYAPFGMWDWGAAPLGVNAFAFGGAAYARCYFAPTVGAKLVIDVVDTDNPAGYVEAGRLVTGTYWSPEFNAAYGAQLTPAKSTTQGRRNDAGDLRTERRPIWRTLSFELQLLRTAADRARMYEILRRNGSARPVFLSMWAEHPDPLLEQSYQIYGKFNESAMSNPAVFGIFAAPLQFEEI